MITARFQRSKGRLAGFCVSGHAGYADYGSDIVCASVTSAVQLTANGITQCLDIKAQVSADPDGGVKLALPQDCQREDAQAFLKALYLHLTVLSQDYQGTIKIIDAEV